MIQTPTIHIAPDGSIEFVYHDDLRDLLNEGSSQIHRASNVEFVSNPVGEGAISGWVAEIFNGPKLGPFERRSAAIEAEVHWLEENQLGKQVTNAG